MSVLSLSSDMEEMGLAPNRLARTAFIEAYSRRGDIDSKCPVNVYYSNLWNNVVCSLRNLKIL